MSDYHPVPLDIDEILKDMVVKAERVRVLYEQYFMGIERIEPLIARKEVQRTMLMLQQQQIRNTGLRFRFNTLLQKWNIYITYWNRILREIENGTYTRHVNRAQRAAARDGKELPAEIRTVARRRRGAPLAAAEPAPEPAPPPAQAAATAAPAPVAARPRAVPPPLPPGVRPPPLPPPQAQAAAPLLTPPPPRPKPPVIPGVSDDDLRQIHARFVEAREKTGERASVPYEVLVTSLSKQVAKVMEKPGVRRIRFDVVVQDGRAVLKTIAERAKPKEGA